MKKRLLAILIVAAMIVCSLASLSFAAETKTATFTFSSATQTQIVNNTLELTDGDVTLHMEDDSITWYSYENYLCLHGDNSLTKITVPEGKKITGVYFYLGCDDVYDTKYYYGFQHCYIKADNPEDTSKFTNNFVTKANGTEVNLDCDYANIIESYIPADAYTLTEFTVEAADSDYWPYFTSIIVSYEDVGTTKTVGADTSDSSDLALFGIMGLLALCGAGFVYKRREN